MPCPQGFLGDFPEICSLTKQDRPPSNPKKWENPEISTVGPIESGCAFRVQALACLLRAPHSQAKA